MITELQSWLSELTQPEYLHVLLNPLPTHGTALGVLVLLVALLLRNRPAQVAGLCVILLSCAAAWFVVRYGHQGYDRIYAISYADAQQWLDVHEQRAERFEWLFYGTAVLALLSLILPARLARTRNGVVALTLVSALFASAAGGWIAYAGGKVRHSEFREGPPPFEVESHADEHEHNHNHQHQH